MNVKALDVYVASIPYGHSTDPRRCVVIAVSANQTVTVAPLSSAVQLFNPTLHFLISDMHPDFSATGLKRASYANGTEIHQIEIAKLTKFIGRFEGKLAKDFKAWIV
jgi:hypothetical protein